MTSCQPFDFARSLNCHRLDVSQVES